MKPWLIAPLIAAALFVALPIQAQEQLPQGAYAPQDDGAEDPEFAAYRAALLLAAQRRDIEGVLSLSAPKIHLDFGGGVGRELFGERLSEKDTELWDALIYALQNGATRRDGAYSAPYWFAMPTDGAYDPYTTAFIPAWNVALHEAASPQSAAVQRISYSFVAVREPYVDPQEGGLQAVTTPDGAKGYIAIDQLRAVVDYRAGFERRDGRWLMTFFIAGD